MDPEELAIVAEEGGNPPCIGTNCCCSTEFCCNDGKPGSEGVVGGGRTGAQMRAVNQVADAVRAEYPGLKIDTFAYEQTAWPPRKTMPAENVIIRVATEGVAPGLGVKATVNSSTYYTAEYIESWSKITSQLSVWDYTANYAYNSLIPNPDWFTVVPARQNFCATLATERQTKPLRISLWSGSHKQCPSK